LTEPLQVGQFAIVDHEPVDRGPNAGVFHGRGPTDDRAELFVLAEGTTPAGEAFAGHVVSAVGHAFAALDMSLTGSLGRLFADAERNLADWNRKSIAQHRVSIGLTCFGHRAGQAVIAQAGPSIAFHLHNRGVTPLYPTGPQADPITGAAMGPQLTRIDFAPGDRLLMLSSAALGELDDELIAGILRLPPEQILPDIYHRVQHLRHITVVLVTGPGVAVPATPPPDDPGPVIDATDPPPDQAPAPSPLPGEAAPTYQPSLFIDDEQEDVVFSARRQLLEITPRRPIEQSVPLAAAEAPAPLLRVSGETTSTLARIAADTQARAAISRAAVASMATAAPSMPAPASRWHNTDFPVHEPLLNSSADSRRKPRRESFTRSLVTPGAPPAPPEVLGADVPLVDDLAAGRRARAANPAPSSGTIATETGAAMNSGGSLVRVRDSMGGRWKGNNTFGRRTATAQLPPTWLVIAIGLGILLLLVGFVTVPPMLDSDRSGRYVELVDGAAQRLASARVLPDPAQKRLALTEAQAMLLEAREIDGAGTQAEQLYNEVAGALHVMDNVVAPASVEALASLEQFGEKAVAVKRMAIGPEAAYLVDANSAQVIAIPLAGGEPHSIYTEAKAQQRGHPVAIAHLDSSDLGGPVLLIADSLNHLWAYSPEAGLRATAFNAPPGLAVTDIAVYGRDLYVLDAAQKAVLRYSQNSNGFAAQPSRLLESDDLAQGRRLTVDTEVIVSTADGTLLRFINDQVSITLSQAGIDRPLVAPETAQSLSKNEIALLDAPNDRIVVFRRDGSFDRQYQHKDFRAASAFAIRDGHVYIFSDSRLRRVLW